MQRMTVIAYLSLALCSWAYADLKTVEKAEENADSAIRELQTSLRSFGRSETQNQTTLIRLENRISSLLILNSAVRISADSYISAKQPTETYHVKGLETAYKYTLSALATLKGLEASYEKNINQHSYYLIRMNGFKLARSIYDNFYTHKALRRVFKDVLGEEKNSGDFRLLITEYLSDKNRYLVKKYIELNREYAEKNVKALPSPESLDKGYNLGNFSDFLNKSASSLTYSLSKGFGNVAGQFKSRKGYLYKNKAAEKATQKKLKPMDILVFKYNFVLTDHFIPGYFSHAAIYFGTEAELKSLGIWNDPAVKPYQDRIRAGETVLEALRPGIKLSSLEEVLNADEFVIMRKKNLSTEEAQEVALRGISRMDMTYDFNFDVSTKMVVCSELPRFSYESIRFPTKKTLGRYTIEPDHVAQLMFYKNSPLEFISNTIGYEGNKFEMLTHKDSNLSRLNFVKENGTYKAQVESCEYKKENRMVYNSGRGGAGSLETVTVKNCKTVLEEKVYKPL
jgi:hypothetical protein